MHWRKGAMPDQLAWMIVLRLAALRLRLRLVDDDHLPGQSAFYGFGIGQAYTGRGDGLVAGEEAVVSLGKTWEDYVDHRVKSGEFNNASVD